MGDGVIFMKELDLSNNKIRVNEFLFYFLNILIFIRSNAADPFYS
jgi:hypothetical protein